LPGLRFKVSDTGAANLSLQATFSGAGYVTKLNLFHSALWQAKGWEQTLQYFLTWSCKSSENLEFHNGITHMPECTYLPTYLPSTTHRHARTSVRHLLTNSKQWTYATLEVSESNEFSKQVRHSEQRQLSNDKPKQMCIHNAVWITVDKRWVSGA